jgi:signal transduction histidine kinase/phage shock protein PspC (stress-responsive transcriptional regulator)
MVTTRAPAKTPPGLPPGRLPRGGFLGLGLFRSRRHRIVAGVAGGLGERLGIDPVLVRIGFVILSLNAGAGVLAYLVLWAFVPEASEPEAERPPSVRRAAGGALMGGGILLLLRELGLWVGDVLATSVMLGALGIAVVWLRSDAVERDRLRDLASRIPSNPLDALAVGRGGKARLALGALFVAAGVATLIWRTNALNAAPGIVFAVAVTIVGLGVFAGPWAWRLARQLSDERRERIRQEERAEMAAHLHDSVLQTLALIQRTDQPKEMVALARSQERELRAWLNGSMMRRGDTIAGAVEEVAAAVELQFQVPVEVVTVGDSPLDERLRSIVDASREATVNAAKHSGAAQISVYVEVEPTTVTAFVRDEGVGFDPDEVASDRRGIAESIRGRMERSGGSATIHSAPGEGTEVQLSIPRSRS